MRALFRLQAGPAVGMGHVVRSLALADELERLGATVVGLLCGDHAGAGAAIAHAGRTWLPDLEREDPVAVDALLDAVARTNADLVIFDQPTPSRPFAVALRARRPDSFLTALDDADLENPALDLLVNLVNHHPTLTAPVALSVAYAEGVEYAILRQRFRDLGQPARRHPAVAGTVLVSLGGADPSRHTLRVLDALQAGWPLGARFQVVIGPGFAHADDVRARMARLPVDAVAYERVDAMETLMARADLGVVSGGSTMLEMAYLGTPAVALPQNDNEARFARHLERAGTLVLGADDRGFDAATFRDRLGGLARDAAARAAASLAGQRLVDGQGARRLAQAVVDGYRARVGRST